MAELKLQLTCVKTRTPNGFDGCGKKCRITPEIEPYQRFYEIPVYFCAKCGRQMKAEVLR